MNKTILATCVFLISVSPARAQPCQSTTHYRAIETQLAQPSSTLSQPGELPFRIDLHNDPVPKKPGDVNQPCPFELAKPCVVPTRRIYASDAFQIGRAH